MNNMFRGPNLILYPHHGATNNKCNPSFFFFFFFSLLTRLLSRFYPGLCSPLAFSIIFGCRWWLRSAIGFSGTLSLSHLPFSSATRPCCSRPSPCAPPLLVPPVFLLTRSPFTLMVGCARPRPRATPRLPAARACYRCAHPPFFPSRILLPALVRLVLPRGRVLDPGAGSRCGLLVV